MEKGLASNVRDAKTFLSLVAATCERRGWVVRDMGELRSRPGSHHVHLYSGNADERGTLEVTFDPCSQPSLRIKVAANRRKPWSERAAAEFEKSAAAWNS